jgi:hypothetical protein
MADSDDGFQTESKRKMRIAYVFAAIALAMFILATTMTALSAAIR